MSNELKYIKCAFCGNNLEKTSDNYAGDGTPFCPSHSEKLWQKWCENNGKVQFVLTKSELNLTEWLGDGDFLIYENGEKFKMINTSFNGLIIETIPSEDYSWFDFNDLEINENLKK